MTAGRLCQCCKIFTDASLNYYLILLGQRRNSQANNKKKAKQQQQKKTCNVIQFLPFGASECILVLTSNFTSNDTNATDLES